MPAADERNRAAQVAAMAHPDRLNLLALVMTAPSGEATLEGLAGAADRTAVAGHLRAMVAVGLLLDGADSYRPSHDALARFGSLAGADPTLAVGDPSSFRHRPDRLLDRISDELAATHAGVLAPETVRDFVYDSYDLLASRATVHQHLPQLTARFAAERLAAMTASRDGEPDAVLFVCVRNAGRSQIAAALMRAKTHGTVRVHTAGTAPAARIDPVVRSELARWGVGDLAEFPRPLTAEVVRASGVVVTMGCGDASPLISGRRYLDWPIDDPAGRPARTVRRIVGDIAERVDQLLVEIRPDAGLS